jgi:pilus assembly protein CpaE
MSASQYPFRVLPISSDKMMLDLIKTTLNSDPSYFFIDNQNFDDDLMECIEKLEPSCILLDYSNSTVAHPLDLIDSISLQFPEIIIVAVLPRDKVAEANRVVLAGARAFLVQPFDQKELLDTLGRTKEFYQRGHKAKAVENIAEPSMLPRGTFVVFSPKGGVGCSTVAINLAVALKEKLQQEVLLMDGKLLFGDLDIMLNLKTHNSIADLLPHIGALDESLLRDVISEHASGIKILPAPANPISAQGIRPEDLHRLLTFAQNIYPNIVIDGGNFLNENAVTFMDASHRIILVVNPDIACLRDASRFFSICHTSLSFPKEKILVVMNQHDQREGISREDFERSLQVKVFATLPWDPRVSLQSINRGVPVVMQGQNIPLRKAFKTMAENLTNVAGYHKANNIPVSTKNILPEILSKSSRLG